jgi:UDP-glucose 4-epimerase
VGCGACTQDVCFVDAVRLVDGRAVISDACRGCGRCVDVCPQDAIEITIEDAQFVERSIARIAPLVDVS